MLLMRALWKCNMRILRKRLKAMEGQLTRVEKKLDVRPMQKNLDLTTRSMRDLVFQKTEENETENESDIEENFNIQGDTEDYIFVLHNCV